MFPVLVALSCKLGLLKCSETNRRIGFRGFQNRIILSNVSSLMPMEHVLVRTVSGVLGYSTMWEELAPLKISSGNFAEL